MSLILWLFANSKIFIFSFYLVSIYYIIFALSFKVINMRLLRNFINFLKAIKNGFKDSEFRLLFILSLCALLLGTVFYTIHEGWHVIDSVYFCISTLTTVGYGDFTPTTTLSKIFTIFYILIGLGIFLLFINVLSVQILAANLDKGLPKEKPKTRATKKK